MEYMFSVDLMVDDTVKTANLLVERLGLPPLRSTWHDPGFTLEDYLYLRAAHPVSQSVPTLIEILNGSIYTDIRPAASGRQAPGRPIETHATVLATKDFPGMIERLRRKGIRHYEMPDPGDGLGRCWFGVADLARDSGEDNEYDPTADGELFLEAISWEGTTVALRGPVVTPPSDGGITRIQARTYLVNDIHATLHSLREALDWPAPHVEVEESELARHVLLQPALATSAALELVQPKGAAGRHGEFFARWGFGPHAIRMEVLDLQAKAADLEARGTPFTFDTDVRGGPLILVDPEALEGTIVEFAEPRA